MEASVKELYEGQEEQQAKGRVEAIQDILSEMKVKMQYCLFLGTVFC